MMCILFKQRDSLMYCIVHKEDIHLLEEIVKKTLNIIQ